MERLDKVLVSQNVGSRKEIGVLARKGQITVNGVVVKKADTKIDPEQDQIAVNGKPVLFQRFVYYMLHKPAGVLSASRDRRAETVLDLLPEALRRKDLFPAGRLDKDTEGLLILTDDGDYAHRMLAPKKHVEKQYLARLDAPLVPDAAERFAAGVELSDLVCQPAKLEILEPGETPLVSIVVHEGKFHQVKRMCAACGGNVTYLKRVRIGSLLLDESLEPGAVRPLTEEERELVFLPME